MSTRTLRYTGRGVRLKDLLGAVLLVLTALLYFEEVARAEVPDAGAAETVVVAER